MPLTPLTSRAIFLGGLLATALGIGHALSTHQTWMAVATPAGVGELLIQLASVGLAITGALGMTPPAFLQKKSAE